MQQTMLNQRLYYTIQYIEPNTKSKGEQGRLSPQDLWRKFPPNLIGHRSFMELLLGPSIKYVTLFLANFDPLPLSHYVAHPGIPPNNTSHISDPRFLVGLVQKIRTKAPCTNSLSIVREGICLGAFVRGFLSVRFCPGWFLSVPPSVRIHLLQQKVKNHFKFHASYVGL